eukprot:scaffold31071_cov152-Skeletonema_dohrnii-CCMP3373.AAC.2
MRTMVWYLVLTWYPHIVCCRSYNTYRRDVASRPGCEHKGNKVNSFVEQAGFASLSFGFASPIRVQSILPARGCEWGRRWIRSITTVQNLSSSIA